jgi:hypothetical protein
MVQKCVAYLGESLALDEDKAPFSNTCASWRRYHLALNPTGTETKDNSAGEDGN